jgi:murein DD-endopeptidase MepM/ murein hydrolase activator NlpD
MTYQAPQVSYQAPQLTYQAPQVHSAPLTTASINAPQMRAPQSLSPQSLAPQPLAPATITTGSISPVNRAPQPMPATLPNQVPNQAPSQQTVQPSGAAGWSTVGGTQVQVGQGETLFSMSRRYGIPVDVLQRTNNITDPGSIRMGQQITIPVYSTTGVAAATPAASPFYTGSVGTPNVRRVPAPTPRPASLRTAAVQPVAPVRSQQVAAAPSAGTHTVAAGETLYGIARRYNMSAQQLIAANGLANPNELRICQRLVVSAGGQPLPPTSQVAQLPSVAPNTTQTPAQIVAARTYTPPQPTQSAPAAVVETAAIQQVAARNDEIAEQTPLQFRWPIRGRVLSTFGTGSNGVRNDGVNIAVPEGASIRAAEEGEVVYAGNELRGFGNLVLIQHRGGYVTAYAHNSRIDVQRGDRVQRGEVIARAGSTGDVETPQLHFEIRRGTTPVDPSPYLPTS